jgi:two-component system, response regulator YesN
MCRVLLVEDEKFIRQGIRIMVERSGTGFTDIQECSNGKEALEKVRMETYDLVILDIRMPQMDGIAFMQEVHKMEKVPKFIIISGYSDFRYAAESLKYGARAYILKPVQRDELIEALKKVEEEIDREESMDVKSRKVDLILDRFRSKELGDIFLSDLLSSQEVKSVLDMLEINIFNDDYQIALLSRLDTVKPTEQEQTFLKMLVDEYCADKVDRFMNLPAAEEHIIMVSQGDIGYEDLILYLKKHLGGQFIVGVSETAFGIDAVRRTYLQAFEALKYKLHTPPDRVISYREICNLNMDYQVPVDSIRKIQQMIGTPRVGELEGLLNGIFSMEELATYHVGYLEGIADNIYKLIIGYFMETIPQKADSMGSRLEELKNIHHYRNVQQYYHSLRDCVLEINDFLITLKSAYGDKNEIDTALQFIHENYHKDINMSMVANYSSLTYTYFSYLFKERTGYSFVDYLRKVRIEKAQELLKQSDLKIAEIGERVGFPNAKHFSRIFRSVVGISPGEYRDKPV